jgi:ABC-type Fe3+/spermidine/putrescine transport system ATPase subunit
VGVADSSPVLTQASAMQAPRRRDKKASASAAREARELTVEGLSKSFGNVEAIRRVSLTVRAGEFVALLGPSGSGKSSLLMTVAGFEKPDAGKIFVGGRDVSGVPTHERGLGVVFQRYALFPHLTVLDNIAYPLRMRGMRGADRRAAVAKIRDLLGLEGLGERHPDQLSGGQQQRVALARALVYQPPVLLMDEPLGALDRKLRDQVQLEIRRIHSEIGTTILYVTHDQDEAMTMADRVAIMDHGELRQYGGPRELYERPADRFVAGFLGRTNFIPGEIVEQLPDGVDVNALGRRLQAKLPVGTPLPGAQVTLSVRPESIRLGHEANANVCRGRVTEVVYQGGRSLVWVDVAGVQLLVDAASRDVAGVRPGADTALSWDHHDVQTFLD